MYFFSLHPCSDFAARLSLTVKSERGPKSWERSDVFLKSQKAELLLPEAVSLQVGKAGQRECH